jgi:hypothetical protein
MILESLFQRIVSNRKGLRNCHRFTDLKELKEKELATDSQIKRKR